jgi:uncharacterized membrane protein
MNDKADRPQRGRQASRPRTHTMRRLGVSAAVGVVAAALASVLGSGPYAPAVGWDATAIVFSAWVWLVVWPMSADATTERATAEDPSRAVRDVLTLSACVASLAAVGIVLIHAHTAQGAAKGLLAALGLLSAAVSWCTVHTLHAALRAALLHRAGRRHRLQPGGAAQLS